MNITLLFLYPRQMSQFTLGVAVLSLIVCLFITIDAAAVGSKLLTPYRYELYKRSSNIIIILLSNINIITL